MFRGSTPHLSSTPTRTRHGPGWPSLYIPAPSLAAVVARQGPLPVDTVLVLMAGVAEALQSIHGAGVVHRDLKPGNVILAADGPRVIDFGISRAVDSSSAALTGTGVRLGTPAFMAPEQVRGVAVGPAVDLFALGGLAYQAATGDLPFGGDAAVFHRILHEEPDWTAVPERLRGPLQQCLAKDPLARPTPVQLIELCRQATDDERLHIAEGWLPPTVTAEVTRYAQAPVPPAPATAVPHAVPPARRRPVARTAVTVGAVLVLLGVGAWINAAISGSGGHQQNAGAPPTLPAATSPATTPPDTAASGPKPSTSPTPATFTLVYQDRTLIAPWGDDYDLTQGKVAQQDASYDTDAWMNIGGGGSRTNSEIFNGSNEDFAFAPNNVTPAQCLTLVAQQPVHSIPLTRVTPSTRLCVVAKNSAGVGIVTITDTHVPPSIKASYWTYA